MYEKDSSRWSNRLELWLTIIMALAAVGTAWAGFQSTKWSGVQANSYAAAGATRTESNRATTEASQLRTIDVISFTSWLNALDQEIIADPSKRPEPDKTYKPDPGSVSGFLFARFRSEFKPAVDAWLATHPLSNPQAPATPFGMAEYRLAADEKATSLTADADQFAAAARQANQRSDNYVLTAVSFALVLFFAGIAGRARGRSQWLLFAFALVVLVGGTIALLLMPVEL